MATDNKQAHESPYPSWYHSLHAYSRASDDLRRQAELMRQRGKAIRIESDALAKWVSCFSFSIPHNVIADNTTFDDFDAQLHIWG